MPFEGDDRLYEWLILPFGLTNSRAVFSRVLGDLIEGSLGSFRFLNDIMVAVVTKEEHDDNLVHFLDLIHRAGIHFNSSEKLIKKNLTHSWL